MIRALRALYEMMRCKKTTVLNVQKLAGILNFLCRGIVPGKKFSRHMHRKIAGKNLKPHHHIQIDGEFKLDCYTWIQFLHARAAVTRPFVDFDKSTLNVDELCFYTDASKAVNLGMGWIYNDRWRFQKWEPGYIEKCNPSLEYLELYALVNEPLSTADKSLGQNEVTCLPLKAY